MLLFKPLQPISIDPCRQKKPESDMKQKQFLCPIFVILFVQAGYYLHNIGSQGGGGI